VKFKRLSEDKVQIIVSSEDLEKREVKKWDLMPSSPKAQELFQEMLDKAYEECGFEVDSETQLMVEAYPMTTDSLVITLTKVRHSEKYILDHDYDEDREEIFDDLEDDELAEMESDELVYLFREFEDAVQLCKQINGDYQDRCNMYKLGNVYYLAFSNPDGLSDHALGMLGEYGNLTHLAESYLAEHGKIMIDKNTIKVLASL